MLGACIFTSVRTTPGVESAEAGSTTAGAKPSAMKPTNDLGMRNIAFSFVAAIYNNGFLSYSWLTFPTWTNHIAHY
jgi:hypothetical protein